jgi:hypothetical protein
MILFEWIAGFFSWLTFTRNAERTAHNTELTELYLERDALREDLVEVMKAYQKLNQDLQTEIALLRTEVEAIAADLRKERAEHAACQRKLTKHAEEIYELKIQVRELMRKEDKRDA